MGLDMYLTRRVHLANYTYDAEGSRLAQAVLAGLGVKTPSDYSQGSISIDLPALYWRKANAIHAWFVANVQSGTDECGEFSVSEEKLVELRALCSDVLSGIKNGADTLPTQQGFFFGSTEYGEVYLDNLKDTVAGIDRVLSNDAKVTPNDCFYYRASW